MNLNLLLRAWIAMSVLGLFAPQSIFAQCNPPASIGFVPPQTSTAFVLKWPTVPGASQYQIRYWETIAPEDKTIVNDCGPAPFTLRGLRKNTHYSLQIRTKCGNATSDWSNAIGAFTLNSSGTCNNNLTGVMVSTGISSIQISWTSAGSHTIRYRLGDSGDWLIPSGAISLMTAPFTINGVPDGIYQVEIKRNCSATAGAYQRTTVTVGNPCMTPGAPVVTPSVTSAMVELPTVAGVNGYNVEYRPGTSGAWINGGNNIPSSIYLLNPPLVHSSPYQVQIQAVCNTGSSGFSPPASFSTTQETGPCLVNKNAGKNMTGGEILQVNSRYNHPSPFTFGSMIGVNDGGLVFRSFQDESSNQITQLTTQFRNFHTMDEDFNASPVSYAQNLKPKETIPEGTPAHTARNKAFYAKYRQHGFNNITGATEILQYTPHTWKEKIYQESDWSVSGPAGIRQSYENYTKKFIDELAPANGAPGQILVANYQVGNELWDYPVKADYQSLLLGARGAFIAKYGPKLNGGWKMKLVAGAFQAFRDDNCNSILRDFSNCGSSLERHDFIGDYLEVTDCDLLRDLDAIDCHPYSFKLGSNSWTYPEAPNSETWQIRNLAAWLFENQSNGSGILRNTRLWSTEYGFDSNPETGVGEKTQSAYLLRGLLLHSRYHFEKVFFYNAYDVARDTDMYYNGLYNSAGFWKLGTHPANNAWASPIIAYGATAKPAWYGMMDFKARFGEHVFYQALSEDSDAFVMLIAKPDSSEPYLVFWSPRMTNDADINQDIPLNKAINWLGAFAGGYTVASTSAQTFSEDTLPGLTFEAIDNASCGSLNLRNIRRNPAFIRLKPCIACPNINNPGSISPPSPSMGGSPFNPGMIASTQAASGGSGGTIVYQWQQSTNNSNFVDIPGATAPSYDPPSLLQTTYFRRAARRSACSDFIYTAAVTIGVGNACPTVINFQRVPHEMQNCNPNGDFYFEIDLDQVTMNDQITLTGLPATGLHIPLCMLNGVALTPASFQTNLHFVSNSSLQWQVNASNGNAQTLLLYYCWADAYPHPVGLTQATSLCSGTSIPCTEGPNAIDPGSDRSGGFGIPSKSSIRLYAIPNPGTDHVQLTYSGLPVAHATLRIISTTGQCVKSMQVADLQDHSQWEMDTHALARGIYFLCLQTGTEVEWLIWEKV